MALGSVAAGILALGLEAIIALTSKTSFFELSNCWLWGELLVGLEERKKQAKGKGMTFFRLLLSPDAQGLHPM